MNGWTAAKHNLKEDEMGAEGIEFTTRSVAGTGGVHADSPAWTAQVIARRTVEDDEFCAAVAARTRQSVAEVKCIFSTAGELLREFLRDGCRVNLADVGFSLTLTGKFPSADAAPDASRNSVSVRAHASRNLTKSIELSELNFVNVTHPLSAHIFSVMDATLRQDGVIADPSSVLVTGEGLLVDQSAADEWVRLVDASGGVVATGRILENDATTLDCSLSPAPPAGRYRIEIRARNGASPTLAPATVRKSVEVK